MKIGILTQPLHTNYGGLLQAYALQTVLKRMGHDVWMVRFCKMIDFLTFEMFRLRLIGRVARFVHRLQGRQMSPSLTSQQKEKITIHTDYFIEKYINPKTEIVKSSGALNRICGKNVAYDAYVVGSDQVWRPWCSPKISHFFLDFAKGQNVKRIAYAASLGVDRWEFSKRDTTQCALLAKKFDAISVREDSAVGLCNKYLGVDALHVLDPTMLLEKEDYINIIRAENEQKIDNDLFCYVLDDSKSKQELIKQVSADMNLLPFFCMPEKITKEALQDDISRLIYPPVTTWLRSFMDAKFVLTDSFHGCVFSIIFNKPFVALGNADRGNARFDSLFKMFGLESRLYDGSKPLSEVLAAPIDWADVNLRRKQWQEKSKQFLVRALG